MSASTSRWSLECPCPTLEIDETGYPVLPDYSKIFPDELQSAGNGDQNDSNNESKTNPSSSSNPNPSQNAAASTAQSQQQYPVTDDNKYIILDGGVKVRIFDPDNYAESDISSESSFSSADFRERQRQLQQQYEQEQAIYRENYRHPSPPTASRDGGRHSAPANVNYTAIQEQTSSPAASGVHSSHPNSASDVTPRSHTQSQSPSTAARSQQQIPTPLRTSTSAIDCATSDSRPGSGLPSRSHSGRVSSDRAATQSEQKSNITPHQQHSSPSASQRSKSPAVISSSSSRDEAASVGVQIGQQQVNTYVQEEEGEEEDMVDFAVDVIDQTAEHNTLAEPQDLALVYGCESSSSPASVRVSRRRSIRVSTAASSRRISYDAGIQPEPFTVDRDVDFSRSQSRAGRRRTTQTDVDEFNGAEQQSPSQSMSQSRRPVPVPSDEAQDTSFESPPLPQGRMEEQSHPQFERSRGTSSLEDGGGEADKEALATTEAVLQAEEIQLVQKNRIEEATQPWPQSQIGEQEGQQGQEVLSHGSSSQRHDLQGTLQAATSVSHGEPHKETEQVESEVESESLRTPPATIMVARHHHGAAPTSQWPVTSGDLPPLPPRRSSAQSRHSGDRLSDSSGFVVIGRTNRGAQICDMNRGDKTFLLFVDLQPMDTIHSSGVQCNSDDILFEMDRAFSTPESKSIGIQTGVDGYPTPYRCYRPLVAGLGPINELDASSGSRSSIPFVVEEADEDEIERELDVAVENTGSNAEEAQDEVRDEDAIAAGADDIVMGESDYTSREDQEEAENMEVIDPEQDDVDGVTSPCEEEFSNNVDEGSKEGEDISTEENETTQEIVKSSADPDVGVASFEGSIPPEVSNEVKAVAAAPTVCATTAGVDQKSPKETADVPLAQASGDEQCDGNEMRLVSDHSQGPALTKSDPQKVLQSEINTIVTQALVAHQSSRLSGIPKPLTATVITEKPRGGVTLQFVSAKSARVSIRPIPSSPSRSLSQTGSQQTSACKEDGGPQPSLEVTDARTPKLADGESIPNSAHESPSGDHRAGSVRSRFEPVDSQHSLMVEDQVAEDAAMNAAEFSPSRNAPKETSNIDDNEIQRLEFSSFGEENNNQLSIVENPPVTPIQVSAERQGTPQSVTRSARKESDDKDAEYVCSARPASKELSAELGCNDEEIAPVETPIVEPSLCNEVAHTTGSAPEHATPKSTPAKSTRPSRSALKDRRVSFSVGNIMEVEREAIAAATSDVLPKETVVGMAKSAARSRSGRCSSCLHNPSPITEDTQPPAVDDNSNRHFDPGNFVVKSPATQHIPDGRQTDNESHSMFQNEANENPSVQAGGEVNGTDDIIAIEVDECDVMEAKTGSSTDDTDAIEVDVVEVSRAETTPTRAGETQSAPPETEKDCDKSLCPECRKAKDNSPRHSASTTPGSENKTIRFTPRSLGTAIQRCSPERRVAIFRTFFECFSQPQNLESVFLLNSMRNGQAAFASTEENLQGKSTNCTGQTSQRISNATSSSTEKECADEERSGTKSNASDPGAGNPDSNDGNLVEELPRSGDGNEQGGDKGGNDNVMKINVEDERRKIDVSFREPDTCKSNDVVEVIEPDDKVISCWNTNVVAEIMDSTDVVPIGELGRIVIEPNNPDKLEHEAEDRDDLSLGAETAKGQELNTEAQGSQKKNGADDKSTSRKKELHPRTSLAQLGLSARGHGPEARLSTATDSISRAINFDDHEADNDIFQVGNMKLPTPIGFKRAKMSSHLQLSEETNRSLGTMFKNARRSTRISRSQRKTGSSKNRSLDSRISKPPRSSGARSSSIASKSKSQSGINNRRSRLHETRPLIYDSNSVTAEEDKNEDQEMVQTRRRVTQVNDSTGLTGGKRISRTQEPSDSNNSRRRSARLKDVSSISYKEKKSYPFRDDVHDAQKSANDKDEEEDLDEIQPVVSKSTTHHNEPQLPNGTAASQPVMSISKRCSTESSKPKRVPSDDRIIRLTSTQEVHEKVDNEKPISDGDAAEKPQIERKKSGSRSSNVRISTELVKSNARRLTRSQSSIGLDATKEGKVELENKAAMNKPSEKGSARAADGATFVVTKRNSIDSSRAREDRLLRSSSDAKSSMSPTLRKNPKPSQRVSRDMDSSSNPTARRSSGDSAKLTAAKRRKLSVSTRTSKESAKNSARKAPVSEPQAEENLTPEIIDLTLDGLDENQDEELAKVPAPKQRRAKTSVSNPRRRQSHRVSMKEQEARRLTTLNEMMHTTPELHRKHAQASEPQSGLKALPSYLTKNPVGDEADETCPDTSPGESPDDVEHSSHVVPTLEAAPFLDVDDDNDFQGEDIYNDDLDEIQPVVSNLDSENVHRESRNRSAAGDETEDERITGEPNSPKLAEPTSPNYVQPIGGISIQPEDSSNNNQMNVPVTPLTHSHIQVVSGVSIKPDCSTRTTKNIRKGDRKSKKKRKRVVTHRDDELKKGAKRAKGYGAIELRAVDFDEIPNDIPVQGSIVQPMQPQPQRRSRRPRLPPLKFWKNEVVRYSRRSSQVLPTVSEVVVDVGSAKSVDDSWIGGRR